MSRRETNPWVYVLIVGSFFLVRGCITIHNQQQRQQAIEQSRDPLGNWLNPDN